MQYILKLTRNLISRYLEFDKYYSRMAGEKILKYLVDTNRPYSCADITVNLRGAFSKTVVQKALDALSETGKIRCKLYGKQKVYVAIQAELDDGTSDTEDYSAQIKSLTEDIGNKSKLLKTAETNLKHLVSTPTNENAKKQIEEKNIAIQAMNAKLNTLRNSTQVITAVDKNKILDEHDRFYKEYRKRKRICSDMLEAVLEAYPKSKKNFLEELCIETDEMVDFKVMSKD